MPAVCHAWRLVAEYIDKIGWVHNPSIFPVSWILQDAPDSIVSNSIAKGRAVTVCAIGHDALDHGQITPAIHGQPTMALMLPVVSG